MGEPGNRRDGESGKWSIGKAKSAGRREPRAVIEQGSRGAEGKWCTGESGKRGDRGGRMFTASARDANAPAGKNPGGALASSSRQDRLDIVVEDELVGVRAEAHRVHLSFPLIVDPGLHGILGEHIPLEHELVVVLQRREGRVQRARH